MKQIAFVYRITNLLNGKSYIGVSKDPARRFRGHAFHNTKTKSLLKAAIKKYGAEHFKLDVLLQATQEYCYMMERILVQGYATQTPAGYNICSGGRGAVGLTGELNGMYGRTGPEHPHFGKLGYRAGVPHTEDTKAKMSATHKGRAKPLGYSEKMREIALARSPELLAKMADARRAAAAARKAVKQ